MVFFYPILGHSAAKISWDSRKWDWTPLAKYCILKFQYLWDYEILADIKAGVYPMVENFFIQLMRIWVPNVLNLFEKNEMYYWIYVHGIWRIMLEKILHKNDRLDLFTFIYCEISSVAADEKTGK